MKVFGMTIARDSDRVMVLIKALRRRRSRRRATPCRTSPGAFPISPTAGLRWSRWRPSARRSPTSQRAPARPPRQRFRRRGRRAGSGDLDVFGLPELVQSLSQSEASGQLVVRDRGGRDVATLHLRRGMLARAEAGHLREEAAFYVLFERPVQGTFEFSRAPASETTVPGVPAGQQFMPLLMEAMRRYDELQRSAAIVGDHVRLRPTGARPTAPPEESDGVFVRDMWTKAKGGTTAAECELAVAADPYRVRALLAYWLEEGVVAVEHVA